jgi:uncharacterized membrane protein YkgB
VGWALIIVGGIALAEKWQPWAAIAGGLALLGWTVVIADFAVKRWNRYRAGR